MRRFYMLSGRQSLPGNCLPDVFDEFLGIQTPLLRRRRRRLFFTFRSDADN